MTNNLDSLVYYVDINIAENNRYLIERGIEPVPDPRAIESARKLKNYKKYSDFDPKGYVESYTESLASGISERKLRKLYEEGTKKDIDEQIKNLRKTLERNDYVGLKEAGDFFNFVENNGEIKDDPYLNPNIGYFFDLPLVKEKEKNGILKKINKFVKKAAPVAAACLVAAIPVGIVGSANVASAQEDRYSKISNIPSTHVDCLSHPIVYINFPIVTVGNIDGCYFYAHNILAGIFAESAKNPNSVCSPLYNEEQFDKYLNSILKDAQKAGETGVKSLIPTPEGEFLDTITHGAYGKVSQINTIAQMGWYLQNISKTSTKMLEEMRKVPEKNNKVFESAKSAYNAELNKIVFDYNLYSTCMNTDKTNSTKLINNFLGDVEAFYTAMLEENDWKDIKWIVKEECGGDYDKFKNEYLKNYILQKYIDEYGYELPPGEGFTTIAATPENLKIMEIAKSIKQKYWGYGYTPPLPIIDEERDDYIYLGNLGYWYSCGVVEDDKIFIPLKMKSNWKKINSAAEFEDYTKYWENKILEDRAKSIEKLEKKYKKIKDKFEDVDGPLVRRIIPEFKSKTEIKGGSIIYPWNVHHYPSCPQIMSEIEFLVKNVNDYDKINKIALRSDNVGSIGYPVGDFINKKMNYLNSRLEETEANPFYKILHPIDNIIENIEENI